MSVSLKYLCARCGTVYALSPNEVWTFPRCRPHAFGLEDASAAFRVAESRPPGFVKSVVQL
jgi:hypothetical protein